MTVNGLFRPFALVDGRAAATWSLSGGRSSWNRSPRWPSRSPPRCVPTREDVVRFLAAEHGGQISAASATRSPAATSTLAGGGRRCRQDPTPAAAG